MKFLYIFAAICAFVVLAHHTVTWSIEGQTQREPAAIGTQQTSIDRR